ncbi:hypothetical protein H9P43_009588 [Blastocladiella emersonii ATCC 22665]|nr:hypothetical protein H9P43_009588 [Blastocladiella emersonii ATCC 22665]
MEPELSTQSASRAAVRGLLIHPPCSLAVTPLRAPSVPDGGSGGAPTSPTSPTTFHSATKAEWTDREHASLNPCAEASAPVAVVSATTGAVSRLPTVPVEVPRALESTVAAHLISAVLTHSGGSGTAPPSWDALYASLVPPRSASTPTSATTSTRVPHGTPPTACGRVFRKNDILYRCATCALDSTCVLCAACYEAQDHAGHDVYVHSSMGGGCCDCGDPEAWKAELHCPMHGTCNLRSG